MTKRLKGGRRVDFYGETRFYSSLVSGLEWMRLTSSPPGELKREIFIDNLLVQIHFIIGMMGWTGLAPCEFEFPFPGSLTSTFLCELNVC